MRLIGYGPGEVYDRLTILARKITESGSEPIAMAPYRAEFDALLQDRFAYAGPILLLGAVNAAIWQREDELRHFRTAGGNPDAAISVACEIQALNDLRAGLIAELNGDGYREKT